MVSEPILKFFSKLFAKFFKIIFATFSMFGLGFQFWKIWLWWKILFFEKSDLRKIHFFSVLRSGLQLRTSTTISYQTRPIFCLLQISQRARALSLPEVVTFLEFFCRRDLPLLRVCNCEIVPFLSSSSHFHSYLYLRVSLWNKNWPFSPRNRHYFCNFYLPWLLTRNRNFCTWIFSLITDSWWVLRELNWVVRFFWVPQFLCLDFQASGSRHHQHILSRFFELSTRYPFKFFGSSIFVSKYVPSQIFMHFPWKTCYGISY